MSQFSLNKSDRLKSKKAIERLFAQGQSVKGYPVVLIWESTSAQEGDRGIHVGFVAPRRKFPKAVDRNKVKRLMREAFRLNKATIAKVTPMNCKINLMVMYMPAEILSFQQVEHGMIKALKRLAAKLERLDS